MMQQILISSIGGLALADFVLRLIGSSIYDVKSIKKTKFFVKSQNSRILRKRQLISVIVCAYNDSGSIEESLSSIKNNSYLKYEVIVIDNASSDYTSALARNFAKNYPKKNVRVVTKRARSNWDKAIGSVVKKYAKGEILLILKAEATLDEYALRNISRHYLLNQNLEILTPNITPTRETTVRSIIETFNALIDQQRRKLQFIQKLDNLQSIVVKKSTFRRVSVLTSARGQINFSVKQRDKTVNYASNVVLKSSVSSLKLTASNDVGALLSLPFVLCYFAIFAALSGSYIFFAIGWVAMIIFSMFVIWSEENLTIAHKLGLSFYAPVMYILFIIQTLIGVVTILWTLVYSTTIYLVGLCRKLGFAFRTRAPHTQG